MEYYERSAELARRGGDVVEEATARNNIGEILSDQGEFEAAEVAIRDALRVWRGANYGFGMAYATLNLGRLAVRRHQISDAYALLDDAYARFSAVGARSHALQAAIAKVEVLLVEGRAGEALVRTAELMPAEHGADSVLMEAWLHRLAGAASAQLGDHQRAREQWDASLAAAEVAEAEFERALTLDAIALVEPASPARAEAAAIFDRMGIRQTLTAALLGHSED